MGGWIRACIHRLPQLCRVVRVRRPPRYLACLETFGSRWPVSCCDHGHDRAGDDHHPRKGEDPRPRGHTQLKSVDQAHFPDLAAYGIGARLHILGPGQTARLIGSIQELRRPANGAPAALDEHGFRGVAVKYTVGFAGEALARALTADLTGTTITWWDDKPAGKRQSIRIQAKNHQQALQSIYVDRLIASYVVGRSPGRNDYALPALYAAGILRDFLDSR